MKSDMASNRIRFAGLEVDLRSGDLEKNGRRFHIQAQPLKALRVLIENAGEVVTREELRKEVWPDETFVDFDHGLNKTIAKLRDVLDDPASDSSLIETIPKQGYRLLAFPERNLIEPNEPVSTPPTPPASLPRSILKRPWAIPVGVLLLVVLSASFLVGPRLVGKTNPPGAVHAIAVLPLENLSGDPAQDYFAAGMTDELITMLAQNSSLRVISRTSVMQYKGVHRNVREIASQLGVEAILEGTVSRSGDKVRVTTQLIYTPTDAHLWAESYVRDVNDVFDLQKEVAQTVARRVNAKFSPLDPSTKPTRRIKPEAYDAYLRGRYFWFADRRLDKARELFTQAVTLQPDYAAAWAGLADVTMVKAIYGDADPKSVRADAEKYVRKALELDDSQAEAHNSMAAIHLFYDWDWVAADKEAQRAIALNPNYAEPHHLRSYALQAMNRFDEGIDEAKQAIALDPGARPWGLFYAYLLSHRFDEALKEVRERSEAHPDDAGLHFGISETYKYKHMDKEALGEYEIALRLSGRAAEIPEVEKAFANGGLRAISRLDFLKLQENAKKAYVSPLKLAEGCAQLGDKEQTIRYLQLALRERAPQLIRIHIRPEFDFVRTDPRFLEIVANVGLKSPVWDAAGH
jgi:TolB-like protein/DNA-binding winged helix-turn-helix (wHTH) protein/Tfp pilus assembly protein PilF